MTLPLIRPRGPLARRTRWRRVDSVPGMIADLVALPVALPARRLVAPHGGGPPAYWKSDGPVPAELVASLRARAASTGLQPLLLNGLSGPADVGP